MNNYITLSGALSSTTTFTIDIWMYPIDGSDNYSTLLAQDNNIGIWYRSISNKITFFYTGADHLSNSTVNLNTWNNVIVQNSGGNVSFYINSIKDTATYTGGPAFQYNLIGDDSKSETYKGRIAVIKVYNRALTSAEVLQNYNATKSRFLL